MMYDAKGTYVSVPYKLELVTGLVERTAWWKDENHKEPANVWWLKGGGLSREATDVEIQLWKALQAK